MKGNFWQNLKKPIIGLAPMDGVTDEPMRQIQCQIAKPDVIYTEFISVEGFSKKPEKFVKKLSFKENERPIVVQIFGYTPECFSKTISELIKIGFDGVDINMGCPARSVLQRGGGAALVGNFSLTEKILLASLKTLGGSRRKIPLSIKTRIAGDKITTKKWLNFLSRFPLAEITVHGRKLKLGNSGPVDWVEIGKAAKIFKKKGIICLGNGGIKTYDEALEKCRKYCLDGVLIGQAVLGNPWIFKKDFSHSVEEILTTILKHGEMAWNFYEGKGYLSVLKHFGWYPRKFNHYKELKKMLLKTRTLTELKEAVYQFKKMEVVND